MGEEQPASFDFATVSLMREALADAWASLTPSGQAGLTKSVLGQRILHAAAAGERDRKGLIKAALRPELAA
jgi:hypothetical protein